MISVKPLKMKVSKPRQPVCSAGVAVREHGEQGEQGAKHYYTAVVNLTTVQPLAKIYPGGDRVSQGGATGWLV